MKKRSVLLGCLVLLIAFVAIGVFVYANQKYSKSTASDTPATSQQPLHKDVREAVWEQLPGKQQERVVWKDGKVSKTTLAEGATISDGDKIVKVDKYAGKEVYVIDFPTDSMAIPNNIIVYADTESFAMIGYGLVD